MRKSPPREPLFSHVRSWANDIPLGSLDQLQQAAGRSRLLRGDADNPASISLPASRESSLQDTGSNDFQQTQKSERSAPDAQDQRRLDTAEAPDIPLPGSSSTTVEAPDVPLPGSSGRRHDGLSSGAGSTVDSLHQLQTAGTCVLDQPHQPRTVEPLDVPLPESSGFGNDGCSSEGVSTVDSFAQLQTMRVPALEQPHQLDTAESPDVTPPESSSLGSDYSSGVDSLAQLQTARVPGPAEQPTELPTEHLTPSLTGQYYWDNIRQLTQILPHLKAIHPPNGRHELVGRLKSIDYFKNGNAPQIGISLEIGPQFDGNELLLELQNMKQADDAVVSRMIIVEDLCSELIEALGFAFDLDPDFFAEHINRSGYNGADYEDLSPERWNTAHLPKSYTSMTWMRPVYQSVKVAELLQTPGVILDMRKESPEAPQPTLTRANSAAVWRDAEFNDKGQRNGQAMVHTPLVDTNIFRQSWLLSERTVSRADFLNVEGELQPGPASQARPYFSSKQKEAKYRPAAWEERVSFCYHGENTGMPIGILLVDPLPAITDLQKSLHPILARNSILQPRQSWPWGARQTSRPGRSFKIPLEIALPMVPRLSFNMPRNKYKANEDQLTSLGSSFVTMVSTFDCIRPDDFSDAGVDPKAIPVVSLSRLIAKDMQVLFRSLDWTLDAISQDSQDDYLMARHLSEWRKLLSHFEIEVPAMAKRLNHFLEFVYRPTTAHGYPNEVIEVLRTAGQDVSLARPKLRDAYDNLRADMQFTESRRSISETKTVTRLTELAFVFIPLSFCASLFSMSVDELENGVPVWIFVVTALATIALAYAVRLFVGSELLVNSTRRSLQHFKARTGLKSEADVPTITLAWLVVRDVWKNGGSAFATSIAKYLGLTVVITLPVAFMWTSQNMGSSFNAAVTLLLFLGIVLTSIMVSAIGKLGAELAPVDEDDPDSIEEV